MKKRALLLGVACLFLTACGDPLIELSDGQSSLLSTYAAGVLLKYSTASKDGLMYLDPAVYAEEEEVETKEEEPQEELPENNSMEEEGGYLSDFAETSVANVSTPLEEVYDFGGAELAVRDYEFKDSYVEGDFFSLTPAKEKKFLLLHLQVTNAGDGSVNFSVPEDAVSFSILINGKAVKAESTVFLDNDLTGLSTKLSAGDSEDAILLFEVSADDANELDSLVLRATKNEKTGSLTIE